MYVFNLAKQHSAMLVNVEHRFYGQSYPTKDMSTENLSLLSADQALADLARLITFVKTDLSTVSSQVNLILSLLPISLTYTLTHSSTYPLS
jgi:hypothetical protein